jgi:hypothetical protein
MGGEDDIRQSERNTEQRTQKIDYARLSSSYPLLATLSAKAISSYLSKASDVTLLFE